MCASEAGGSDAAEAFPWLASRLGDPRFAWSMGSFGAIAGFSAEAPAAPVREAGGAVSLVSGQAALRLLPRGDLTPVAFEVLSSDPSSWNHAVALCLPAPAMPPAGDAVLAERGEDEWALLRPGLVFDLGFGLSQAAVRVRTDDGALIDGLRGLAGAPGRDLLPALAALLARHAHVRLMETPIGRIETLQAPMEWRLPHPPGLIPQLLAGARTHAATSPIPEGLVPCGYVFPPHPLRRGFGTAKPFDPGEHEVFQAVLARYGVARLSALKAALTEAVARRQDPRDFPPPADRFESACIRVALRQIRHTRPADDLTAWLARFDGPARREASA